MKQKIKKKYTLLLNICEIIILLIRNLFQLQIVSKILENERANKAIYHSGITDSYNLQLLIYIKKFGKLKNYAELCGKWCYKKRPIISALRTSV